MQRTSDRPTYTPSRPNTTALELCAVDWAPAVARAASASGSTSAQDRAFIGLQNAYRAHGGLSRLHSMNIGAALRSECNGCDVGDLVADGNLFSFNWYHITWIPMFQFAMPGPTVAVGPQRVVAELGRDFDGWALASWFVAPNFWLGSHSPIECLDQRLPDVLEAARADRFVTSG